MTEAREQQRKEWMHQLLVAEKERRKRTLFPAVVMREGMQFEEYVSLFGRDMAGLNEKEADELRKDFLYGLYLLCADIAKMGDDDEKRRLQTSMENIFTLA